MHPRLQEIAKVLENVEQFRPRIQWISQLGIKYDRIAEFGCGDGNESLAFAMVLKAREIIGLDKDGDIIQPAPRRFTYIDDLTDLVRESLKCDRDLPGEVRRQLDDFANEYEGLIKPSFTVGDMTQQTALPSDHFDLAYCKRVLYLIACHEREKANDRVLLAIQEMARVIKPEGHILAIEPHACKNGQPVDLRPQFEQAGLLSVPIEEGIAVPDHKTIYFYRRSSSF